MHLIKYQPLVRLLLLLLMILARVVEVSLALLLFSLLLLSRFTFDVGCFFAVVLGSSKFFSACRSLFLVVKRSDGVRMIVGIDRVGVEPARRFRSKATGTMHLRLLPLS